MPVFLEAESHPWFQLQALPACLEATSVSLTSGDQWIKMASFQRWEKPACLFLRCPGPPCGQHRTPHLSEVGSLTPGLGNICPRSLAGAVLGGGELDSIWPGRDRKDDDWFTHLTPRSYLHKTF